MQDLPDRIEPTPRPGSVSYYCLVFTPAPQRPFAHALYALCRELDVARNSTDPGVARLKLQWWREELMRAAAGEARHPITRELGGGNGAQLPDLTTAVEHRERELAHTSLDSETEFEEWAAQGPGTVLRAWATNLAPNSEPDWDSSLQILAQALQRLDTLQRAPLAARRGIALHPTERMAQFGVTLPALGEPHPDTAVRDLVKRQRQGARQELERAIETWPHHHRRRHAPLLVLADLRHATLLEQERQGVERPDERVVLTPLRKVWRGWRRVRRERR